MTTTKIKQAAETIKSSGKSKRLDLEIYLYKPEPEKGYPTGGSWVSVGGKSFSARNDEQLLIKLAELIKEARKG